MNVHQFEQMKQELFQEEIFKRQKTLCIDIENVCLRKVEIFDPEEYQLLREEAQAGGEEQFYNYILVKNYEKKDIITIKESNPNKLANNASDLLQIIENYKIQVLEAEDDHLDEDQPILQNENFKDFCCKVSSQGKICICKKTIYKIRPYSLEILRSNQSFFEMIAYSKIHYSELEQIADHIEQVLNKPITDLLIRRLDQYKQRN